MSFPTVTLVAKAQTLRGRQAWMKTLVLRLHTL